MDNSWSARAACHGLDPVIFFPTEDEDAGAAKAICAACTVSEACLEFALGVREREGVWGGCTAGERRRIVRRRRAAS